MDETETLQSKAPRMYRRCLTDRMGYKPLWVHPMTSSREDENDIIQWQQNPVCPGGVPSAVILLHSGVQLGKVGLKSLVRTTQESCPESPSGSDLTPCNQEPCSEVLSLSWEIRFWCSVFPPAETSVNWEGKYRNCRGFLICLLRGKCTASKQQGRSWEWMWHIQALT